MSIMSNKPVFNLNIPKIVDFGDRLRTTESGYYSLRLEMDSDGFYNKFRQVPNSQSSKNLKIDSDRLERMSFIFLGLDQNHYPIVSNCYFKKEYDSSVYGSHVKWRNTWNTYDKGDFSLVLFKNGYIFDSRKLLYYKVINKKLKLKENHRIIEHFFIQTAIKKKVNGDFYIYVTDQTAAYGNNSFKIEP